MSIPSREPTARVSVVIPTCNRAATIHLALESVLSQRYGNVEVLVVDDGSRDNTRGVVARYGDRVRYLHQENAGPAAARNRGLRSATGEFIAFLDSDDAWLPSKLELQIAAFERNPRLGIVATNVIYRYPWGEVRSDYGDDDSRSIREKFLDNIPMVTSSVMVTKEAVAAVGGFDESLMYAEDWDYFYRIARSYEARILPDPLVIFDRTGQGPNLMADTAKRERLVRDTLACLERIYAFPENRGQAARKRRKVFSFLRWIALNDVVTNPAFSRKYLLKALAFKPWDAPLYGALLKTLLVGTPLYPAIRRVTSALGGRGPR